jgi:hypothetical protein
MDLATQLPQLLGLAWLMPLASFVLILFFGPKMGPHGRNAAWVATAAIVTSLVLSLVAFVSWLGAHPVTAVHHGGDHGAAHAGDHADAAGHGAPQVWSWQFLNRTAVTDDCEFRVVSEGPTVVRPPAGATAFGGFQPLGFELKAHLWGESDRLSIRLSASGRRCSRTSPHGRFSSATSQGCRCLPTTFCRAA